jgi:chorismate mutase
MSEDLETLAQALRGSPGDAMANARHCISVIDAEVARHCISVIDAEVVRLLAMRQQHAQSIGLAKRDLGRPVYDHARETQVVKQFCALAKERGLPPGHAETIIGAIVAMAHSAQKEEDA